MPSSPEATPAVAPVTPRMSLVLHDMSLMPETADESISDKPEAADVSTGALSGG